MSKNLTIYRPEQKPLEQQTNSNLGQTSINKTYPLSEPVFISIITLMVFFFVAFMIFLILWCIYFVNFKNLEGAFIHALYNSVECSTNPIMCSTIQGNDYSPPSTVTPNTMQKEVAQFCIALISPLEYPDNTSFSPDVELIKSITTNETNAPTFGGIFIDSTSSTLYIGNYIITPFLMMYQIAFRGTKTGSELANDLRFGQDSISTTAFAYSFKKKKSFSTTISKSWSPNGQSIFTFNNLCSNDTQIHQGFLNVFNEIKDEVLDTVNDTKNRWDNIIVTGHSLGAAIASLVSLYIKSMITDKTYQIGNIFF